MSLNITLPVSYEVKLVNDTLQTMVPVSGNNLPISLEDVVSKMVTLAGYEPVYRIADLNDWLIQTDMLKQYVQDPSTIDELKKQANNLYLVLMTHFAHFNLYDESGCCPYRYRGFFSTFNFDIIVGV